MGDGALWVIEDNRNNGKNGKNGNNRKNRRLCATTSL